MEIVRGIYEAFAQRDGATPFKHYAPDIEWESRGGLGVVAGSVYHGHDGVKRSFMTFSRLFASLSSDRWS